MDCFSAYCSMYRCNEEMSVSHKSCKIFSRVSTKLQLCNIKNDHFAQKEFIQTNKSSDKHKITEMFNISASQRIGTWIVMVYRLV